MFAFKLFAISSQTVFISYNSKFYCILILVLPLSSVKKKLMTLN